jgi:hypothetical protein
LKKLLIVALGWAGTLIPVASLALLSGVLLWLGFGHDYGILLAKIALLFLIPAFFGIRGLFLPEPVPTGYAVSEAEAPGLFGMMHEIERVAEAPTIHNVLLVRDFNCAVFTRARAGILGLRELYILIGLPLMLSLTQEQFRAMLTHEYGHISRRHGHFGTRIYAFTNSWERLARSLSRQTGVLARPLLYLYSVYAGFFSRVSLDIVRQHEREADALAAHIAGSRPAAVALAATHARQAFIEEVFWTNQLERDAILEMKPPKDVYFRLSETAHRPIANPIRYLQRALQLPGAALDSHPPLAERLAAFGVDLSSLEDELRAPLKSDASILLGKCRGEALSALSREWVGDVFANWETLYRRQSALRDELAALDARGADLSPMKVARHALLSAMAKRDGSLDALAAARETSYDETIELWYGGLLGRASDERAVPVLKALVDEGAFTATRALEYLIEYYSGREMTKAAASAMARLEDVRKRETAVLERFGRVDANEAFESPSLPEDVLVDVRASLKHLPEIDAAFLVRRKVEVFGRQPVYLLAIKCNQDGESEAGEPFLHRIISNATYPNFTLPLVVQDTGFLERITRITGSTLFAS